VNGCAFREPTTRASGGRDSTDGAAGKFDEILALIEATRRRAYQVVNTELVGLYWKLGEHISKRVPGTP
jgi:hypothetical protein